jgi:hypothetical protein
VSCDPGQFLIDLSQILQATDQRGSVFDLRAFAPLRANVKNREVCGAENPKRKCEQERGHTEGLLERDLDEEEPVVAANIVGRFSALQD